MWDLREKLLPRLLGHRLPGLEMPAGSVVPYYDGLSLVNLPASICGWLGVPAVGMARPLVDEIGAALRGKYRHVIVVLADALGLRQLEGVLAKEAAGQAEPAWSRLLDRGKLAALTSIAPSTTAAALTSLWTGLSPAQHSMTGYEIWLKEYSMIINAITHSPAVFSGDPGGLRRAGFDPEQFLNAPTLGARLAEHGVSSYAYHHTSIHRSSLSNMLQPGVKAIAYRTLNDVWLTVENVLKTRAGERSYHYIYWGDLDELLHRYGPGDERIGLELESFGRGLARFAARLGGREDTLLLALADHGQVETLPDPRYNLHHRTELLDCLTMLPSGEPRLAYLYARTGKVESVRELIEQTWPGEFSVFRSEAVLSAGLLGEPVAERTRERVGDWMVAATGGAYLWWSNKENTMRGRHGGLTEAEMLVPLMMIKS